MSIETPNNADLLRWWHQYQAQQQTQMADLIRNSILQNLFVARRHLESLACSQAAEAESKSSERCLAELAHVYTQLEDLSNGLDDPFLQEPLPLALQHATQPWQDQLDLDIQLPEFWAPEPSEHTRLLIMFVETLLNQLTDSNCSYRGVIELKRHNSLNQLVCQVFHHEPISDEFKTHLLDSLVPFLQTFRLFTDGECEQLSRSQEFIWIFRWAPPLSAFLRKTSVLG
ncbi:MAG: hypothetical protein F6K00_12405 [Leptolyngbya sp. SIOISBB]|nr:hypothetical protein [Leptolyngbya sp. SIOISBB]